MDKIVQKLSEVEATAAKIMEGVSDKKKDMAKEYEAKCKAFDQETDFHTADKLKEIRKKLKANEEAELSDQRKRTDEIVARMESYYQDHNQELALKVYNKLIGM